VALPLAYVETTIPSFYWETRTEPEMVARRQWTREWWDTAQERYLLVNTSLRMGVPVIVTPLELMGELA